MRHLYVMPLDVYQANVPEAPHGAYYGPDVPGLALVYVEHWPSPALQDAWEDLPGIEPQYPEDMGKPLAELDGSNTAALAQDSDVANGLAMAKPNAPAPTLRSLHKELRRRWPAWRH